MTSHTDHSQVEIHLPPNSWVPLSLALSLTLTFIGFLLTPVVWIVGLLWVVGTLSWWLKSARSEYLDLPEAH